MRSIDKIITAQKVRMGKFEIAQPLPAKGVKQVDPFLLLHHAGPKQHEPGAEGLNVEAHPHTGFEPVTFVFSGELEHRDSLGNHSIIRSGGVQWVTAGKGIIHSEKASPEFIKKGGEFEIIQLWINLKKKHKRSAPAYFGYEAADIPYITSEDGKSRLNIISGTYNKITGPINSSTDVKVYTGVMHQDAVFSFSFSESENVLIYVLGGLISIGNNEISNRQLIVFKNDEKDIIVRAIKPSKLLILSGVPYKEPVYHYGPFVLNSKDEVIEAIRAYESGEMGYLA
jgi:redox-sensitive bicupin YhaK (pirin superfamily)